MPNRIIKESICTSENIEKISPEAEILFYRLIVNCDDFGRMDGRLKIIKSRCYPLKSDDIICNLTQWINELVLNDLITIYQVDNQNYIFLNSWENHQQKRAKHSKYPSPNGTFTPDLQSNDFICNQMQSNDSPITRNEKRETRNEKRETIAVVFKTFEDNFQKLTEYTTNQLNDLIDEYSAENLNKALNIAIDANKRNLRYVEGILKNGTHRKGNKLPSKYTEAPPDPERDAIDISDFGKPSK